MEMTLEYFAGRQKLGTYFDHRSLWLEWEARDSK